MSTGAAGNRILSERSLGGAAIALVSIFALVATRGLDSGTFAEIGPGLIPRVLASILLVLGISVSASGFFVKEAGSGEAVFQWSPRAIVFILGAVVLFGLTVRLIGLTAAAPLAILTAGLASKETKWPELLAFALALTALCTLLFRFLLGLPIPVAPWLIGY
ncbi:MAG: tripartite tricarboxylate transporter TctB family protein [Rhizobiales bacterium]|nr:tripartite tricarboxylate transporter TctB family protein [Hyphomicrobiales bacterium]